MSKKDNIIVKYSSINEQILIKLKQLKYIGEYQIKETTLKNSKNKTKIFNITLFYRDGVPAVTDVLLFSKPGRRYYASYKDLKPVVGGMGHSLISTSKGIMTNYEARKAKLGGELLFNLW